MVGLFGPIKWVLFLWGVVLLFAPKETILEEIIFVINGTPITSLEFLEKHEKSQLHWNYMRKSGLETKDFPSKQEFAKSIIEDLLVQQEVDNQSVKVRDEDVLNSIRSTILEPQKISSIEDFKNILSIQGLEWDYFFQEHRKRMYQNFFLEKIAPPQEATHEEIRKYYQENKESFVIRKKLLRISQVYLPIPPEASFTEISKIKNDADDLRTQIVTGSKTFAQVAKIYFQDPFSGEKQGDVGWVGEEDFAPTNNIWIAIKNLKKEQISKVISLPGGFSFFQVKEVLKNGYTPFERARKIIKYKLRELASIESYNNKVRELREKSTIKIYTKMFGSSPYL